MLSLAFPPTLNYLCAYQELHDGKIFQISEIFFKESFLSKSGHQSARARHKIPLVP